MEPRPNLRQEPTHPDWLQVFRDVTNATNERTCLFANIPSCGVGHTAGVMHFECESAVASALLMANVNSIPLDWVARTSVGGTHLSLFVLRQLPVLPPGAYLNEIVPDGSRYCQAVAARVVELTYTTPSMEGFARDLGYDGQPFKWRDDERLRLRCELDAIFAHMYGLARRELAWMLNASPPSVSFPRLKSRERKIFGEYRSRRLVLRAFDQIASGEEPRRP